MHPACIIVRFSTRYVRLLHTMLRVGDLEKSLGFYCEVLGMQLLRRNEYPSGRFTLAFVGYGDEARHSVIELTHNSQCGICSFSTFA